MTNKKGNRKQKWRNITLNQANIDEYLQDLYNETSGNYITQGVSFNKDDSYQMTLLRNALVAHGSFSGFIKSLLHSHFDKHNMLDDTIWQPNRIEDIEESSIGEDEPSSSPFLSSSNKEQQQEDEEVKETPISPTPAPPRRPPSNSNISNKNRLNNFPTF